MLPFGSLQQGEGPGFPTQVGIFNILIVFSTEANYGTTIPNANSTFRYVACLCKSYYLSKDPEHWGDIAWSLALPYDEVKDYHPEFSGYTRPEQIKQADVVLLGYPLQYPMNE